MSKEKSKELYRMHAIRGYRLSKELEDKSISQAELLRRAKARANNYFNMSPQTLNQIIHGVRPLHYSDAEIFAEILGVSPGYLMGSEESEETRQVLAWEKNAQKYNALLNQIQANIFGYSGGYEETDEICLESYGVTYNPGRAEPEILSISVNDMDNFYKDVCNYIKKRFDVLMAISEREA